MLLFLSSQASVYKWIAVVPQRVDIFFASYSIDKTKGAEKKKCQMKDYVLKNLFHIQIVFQLFSTPYSVLPFSFDTKMENVTHIIVQKGKIFFTFKRLMLSQVNMSIN